MKSAYPNFAPNSIYTKPLYNLNKWLDTMRSIYVEVYYGHPIKTAFAQATQNWDASEKTDFASWMEYYQSDNQNKYKKANLKVEGQIGSYFLPVKHEDIDMSQPMDVVHKDINHVMTEDDKRHRIEEQRKKIISRLNSAIKHLTAHEGHLLAGKDFERLLASVYELIKQVQTVNKVSLSNQIYYDVIIRKANQLRHSGFEMPADFLCRFAQGAVGALDASGPLPIASENSGVSGGTLGNVPPPMDAIAPGNKAMEDVLKELMDNLETGGFTDNNFSLDEEDEDIGLDDDLEVEAQLAPAPAISAPPPVQDEELEVSLPKERANSEETTKQESVNKIDNIIDDALSNVSIQDVINKIENVNAIFQNRNIARELSIIDLMLSNLGLSSYFTNLSEIIQKNHEANNYSISRLSDILTKLRGAITNTSTLIFNENTEISPRAKEIQENLENQRNKDQRRKEVRKQLADEELAEDVASTKPNPGEVINPAPGSEINQTPTQIVQ